MATPVGYPDWQRLVNRVDGPKINQTVNAANTFDSGTIFVGGYESLGLTFNPSGTGHYQVFVTWYEDQGATQQILTYSLDFGGSAGPAYFPLPVDAQYVRIQVTVGSGGAGEHYQIVLTPSVNESNAGYPAGLLLVNNGGTSVGAGGNEVHFGSPLVPGNAALEIWTDSASWSAQLFALIGGTVYQQFWFVKNAPSGFVSTIIGLPPAPLKVQFNNFSASAQSLQVSLATLR
jgi:hypothetical protein